MSIHYTTIDNDGGGQLPVGVVPPAAGLSGLLWYLPCTSPPSGAICACSGVPVVTTATMFGAIGRLYTITLLIRGVVEINSYSGSLSGMFCTGGVSTGANNQYHLQISDPVQSYWLNAGVVQIDGYCFLANYTASVQMRTGATITLTADATDGGEYANFDNLGVPIIVPDNEPLHPIQLEQPVDGQFMQMDVMSVV